MLRVLEEDFARIPELLGRPTPEPAPSGGPRPAATADPSSEPLQLGLF
jgi:hypothetical protein